MRCGGRSVRGFSGSEYVLGYNRVILLRVAAVLDRFLSLSACRALAVLAALAALGASAATAQTAATPGSAPDFTHYQRPLVAGEGRNIVIDPVPQGILVDTVVSAGLGATDTEPDTETCIAVDPSNPTHLTIAALSGSWTTQGSTAPLFVSIDAGATWAKVGAIPMPAIDPSQYGTSTCPCDQTFDIGSHGGGLLYGSMLGLEVGSEPIWTGSTNNPTDSAAWSWLVTGGFAAPTNHTIYADQPWLVIGPDPVNAAQDNVYVGYTDYNETTPANHVSASLGFSTPVFPELQDTIVGTSSGAGFLATAAVRLATDHTTGAVWATWEDNISLDLSNAPAQCPRNVTYRLARSLDHGQTWSLNGGPSLAVVTNQSDEGWPDNPGSEATACRDHVEKFGTVNALLGGTVAIAVDPTNGDIYQAVHNRQSGSGHNWIDVLRLHPDSNGIFSVVTTSHATADVEAALPSLAIAANGTIGLLYTIYNGFVSGFPQFETHLTQSVDHGQTWPKDRLIAQFLSPATDNGAGNQRVLGDYQQMKAVANTFFAAFPANGALAGRSTSNIDPFFYVTQADDQATGYYTVTPCRMVDTRNAEDPLGGPALAAGQERTFALTGACDIPATAKSLALNVTITQAGAIGDLRLYAAGTYAPATSTINFQPNATRANNSVVALGEQGSISVRNDSTQAVHVVLDVTGYFQ
jgi:hypothetical protein